MSARLGRRRIGFAGGFDALALGSAKKEIGRLGREMRG